MSINGTHSPACQTWRRISVNRHTAAAAAAAAQHGEWVSALSRRGQWWQRPRGSIELIVQTSSVAGMLRWRRNDGRWTSSCVAGGLITFDCGVKITSTFSCYMLCSSDSVLSASSSCKCLLTTTTKTMTDINRVTVKPCNISCWTTESCKVENYNFTRYVVITTNQLDTKQLELLSTPNLAHIYSMVHMYSMVGPRQALTVSSQGYKVFCLQGSAYQYDCLRLSSISSTVIEAECAVTCACSGDTQTHTHRVTCVCSGDVSIHVVWTLCDDVITRLTCHTLTLPSPPPLACTHTHRHIDRHTDTPPPLACRHTQTDAQTNTYRYTLQTLLSILTCKPQIPWNQFPTK